MTQEDYKPVLICVLCCPIPIYTWEKNPNNIEIRPNFPYSVSRGLATVWLCRRHRTLYFLHCFCTVFKLFENCPFFKPFGKKTRICTTGLETGCKPVLFEMF